MGETYLARAKKWIEKSFDLNQITIETTMTQFQSQIKQLALDPEENSSAIHDLRETLEYLEEELFKLVDRDLQEDASTSESGANNDTYRYDPTPLVAEPDGDLIILSIEEKKKVLEKIRQSTLIDNRFKEKVA